MANRRFSMTIKVDALNDVLKDAEIRARRAGIPFHRDRLPGRKRDLFIVARKLRPELADVSSGVLERYMGFLICKFPNVTPNLPYQDAYRRLFPECFSLIDTQPDSITLNED